MFKSKYSGYRRDGVRILPFGGSKQQNTTAQTTTTDARQVNTSTNTNYDLSTRTNDSNNTSLWSDASVTKTGSDNTTTYDSSTTITNLLDGGAISGMAGVAGSALSSMSAAVAGAFGLSVSVAAGANAATASGYDFADGIFDASLQAMNANNTRAYDAWDRAAKMEHDSLLMTSNASKTALDQIQNAYADAKGTTQANQQTMMVVAGVAALAILMSRKG